MERQTGNRPAALDGPGLPPEVEHVWRWFIELARTRGSNGFGFNPIDYKEVASWVLLTGTIIYPSEVEAIFQLDRVWLDFQAKQMEANRRASSTTKG